MLIDTHCHINMMIKKEFDVPLSPSLIPAAQKITQQARKAFVDRIVNVGTSLVESENCVMLAQNIDHTYATIGIHPNDCTAQWQDDIKKIQAMLSGPNSAKIVGIGECGMDRHYPDYNLQRQHDAFTAQIELALEYDRALVVHSRDAYDETLRVLEEYKHENLRAVMHCFSYDQQFADTVIEWGFVLGLGGTITYPKNNELRSVAQNVPLSKIVLETDAPFLPIQSMRGKQNGPQYIKDIAEFLAELRKEPYEAIAQETTRNACKLFQIT